MSWSIIDVIRRLSKLGIGIYALHMVPRRDIGAIKKISKLCVGFRELDMGKGGNLGISL